ncbi:MAG: fused MFS/spermidine synthase [Bacillota bacterium]
MKSKTASFRGIIPPAVKKPIRRLADKCRREKVVFETKTQYSRLRVIDKGGCRYLVFDDRDGARRDQPPELIYQSVAPLADKGPVRAAYVDYFNLTWIFHPGLRRICMIGLGGGTLPRQFLRDYPELLLTTVEIDPVVVEVAFRYFDLPKDNRHLIIVDDGRNYLEQCGECYDAILLDAFFARSIPYRLFTCDFFISCAGRLTPQGLLAVNINGALAGPGSTLCRSICKTLSRVFPELYLFAAKKETPAQFQNVIVFAPLHPLNLSPEDIYSRAGRLVDAGVIKPDYARQAAHLYESTPVLDDAIIFTDQSPPAGGALDLYFNNLIQADPGSTQQDSRRSFSMHSAYQHTKKQQNN